MAATEGKLGKLHEKLAEVMGNALDQHEIEQRAYEAAVQHSEEMEDPALLPLSAPNLNPSLLSVIERFLGTNKITCVPEEGNAMGDLEQKLAAKKERKQRRQVGNVVHLDEER